MTSPGVPRLSPYGGWVRVHPQDPGLDRWKRMVVFMGKDGLSHACDRQLYIINYNYLHGLISLAVIWVYLAL